MLEGITGMLVNVVDTAFSPLAIFNPAISLFIVSTFITVLVIVLSKFATNRKAMKEIKDKLQDIREQLTAAQKSGDNESASKFLSEMMSVNNEYMKHMYKGLFVSLIVITIFLPWVRYSYGTGAVASLPFNVPMLGSELNWVLWYILVSFTMGWVIRKLFGFE